MVFFIFSFILLISSQNGLRVQVQSFRTFYTVFFIFPFILLTSSQSLEIIEALFFLSFFPIFASVDVCSRLSLFSSAFQNQVPHFISCLLFGILHFVIAIVPLPASCGARIKLVYTTMHCWLFAVCKAHIYGDKNCFAQVAGTRGLKYH